MTLYVVTGRPVGQQAEEIDYAGVGATVDVKLTAEREAELIGSGVLRKADKTDRAEAKAEKAEKEDAKDAKGT